MEYSVQWRHKRITLSGGPVPSSTRAPEQLLITVGQIIAHIARSTSQRQIQLAANPELFARTLSVSANSHCNHSTGMVRLQKQELSDFVNGRTKISTGKGRIAEFRCGNLWSSNEADKKLGAYKIYARKRPSPRKDCVQSRLVLSKLD